MQGKMLKKRGNLLVYSTYNSTKNKYKQNVVSMMKTTGKTFCIFLYFWFKTTATII